MPPPSSGASGHRGAAGWVPMALRTPLNTHKSVGSPAGRRPDQRYEVCFAITLVKARSGLVKARSGLVTARSVSGDGEVGDGDGEVGEGDGEVGDGDGEVGEGDGDGGDEPEAGWLDVGDGLTGDSPGDGEIVPTGPMAGGLCAAGRWC